MPVPRPLLALLAASLTAAAPAQTPAQPRAQTAPSPFLGTWELDLTRMPDTYGPPPKRVLYAFKDVGAGEWTTTIDITGRDDTVRHIAIRYRRDGKAVPGAGDTADGDTAAVGSPTPNVLVMSLATGRKLGSVRTYTVSTDGREMTESAANVTNEGEPFVRHFHFRRIG